MTPRTIRVFIASPGDLSVERMAFKKLLDELNAGFGDQGRRFIFEPLGWEDTLSPVGRRTQSVINLEVDRCDVFVLVLYARWGQDAPDAKPYSSYTEEEFHRALNRWNQTRAPEIFVFFKDIAPLAWMADAGPQLQKVLAFRQLLTNTRQVLPVRFADKKDFKEKVGRHLRGFAEGKLPQVDDPRDKVILPLAKVEDVKVEWAAWKDVLAQAEQAQQVAKAATARAEMLALDVAKQAAKGALEGRVGEARRDFDKATEGTTSLSVLDLAYEFYFRIGELGAAEEMLEHWLAISGRDKATAETAAALGNLGLIYRIRGEQDKAQEMLQKVLDIHEEVLGKIELHLGQMGPAPDEGNRAKMKASRIEMDRAEELLQKALIINLKLRNPESMDRKYTDLGQFYWAQGELERVEKMIRRGLKIDETLGRREGEAIRYDSLGLIHQTRGELDQAYIKHRDALEIDEKLRNSKGIARRYGNLGLVFESQDKLEQAQEMHEKSLEIEEALKRDEGMARQYGNLGVIYRKRGDLKQAKEMHDKALKIEEKLANQEEMAIQYRNLGLIYEAQDAWQQAEEMHQKALAIFEKLGHQEYMATEYENLGVIYETLKDRYRADEMFSKGRAIEEKLRL